MAGVTDKGLASIGPWPQGVNNMAGEGKLPTDSDGNILALREADNIDFDRSGYPRSRAGSIQVLPGELTHSLWSDDHLPFGLFVDDGFLCVIDGSEQADSLGIEVGHRPMSYALINDRVFYSNRVARGVVGLDLSCHDWAPAQPAGQPDAAAVTGYGLQEGKYQVAITFTDLLGRESGSTVAVAVQVPENGGIELSNMPQPPDLVQTPVINVYCTGPNDQVLRLSESQPSGVNIGAIHAAARGRTLTTQHLAPMPAAQIVRYGDGRQWVAFGDEVGWSAPLRYGLWNPGKNRMHFNGEVTLLEPVGGGTGGAGIFVATRKRTMWFGGSDPSNFTQAIVGSAGVIPGSSCMVPGQVFGLDSDALVPVWLSTNGKFYAGLPGGQIISMKEGQAVVDNADRAASMFRQANGIQHFVAALRSPRKSGLAITDKPVVHVIYDGTNDPD